MVHDLSRAPVYVISMASSGRITEEDVLHVFERIAAPAEALSTREVADALECARRTAYERLSELADDGRLNTKKVGGQVRIWWLPSDQDDSETPTAEVPTVSELTTDHVLELEFHSEQLAQVFLEGGGIQRANHG